MGRFFKNGNAWEKQDDGARSPSLHSLFESRCPSFTRYRSTKRVGGDPPAAPLGFGSPAENALEELRHGVAPLLAGELDLVLHPGDLHHAAFAREGRVAVP